MSLPGRYHRHNHNRTAGCHSTDDTGEVVVLCMYVCMYVAERKKHDNTKHINLHCLIPKITNVNVHRYRILLTNIIPFINFSRRIVVVTSFFFFLFLLGEVKTPALLYSGNREGALEDVHGMHLVISNHVDDGISVPPRGKTLPESRHTLVTRRALAFALRRASTREMGGGG